MPYTNYDPDSPQNWYYEYNAGKILGAGRGMAGSVGNGERQAARTRPPAPAPSTPVSFVPRYPSVAAPPVTRTTRVRSPSRPSTSTRRTARRQHIEPYSLEDWLAAGIMLVVAFTTGYFTARIGGALGWQDFASVALGLLVGFVSMPLSIVLLDTERGVKFLRGLTSLLVVTGWLSIVGLGGYYVIRAVF